MLFGTGELVWFEDLDGQVYLSVILEDGVCGYGGDTRIVFMLSTQSLIDPLGWPMSLS